jgi:hypothetical protein
LSPEQIGQRAEFGFEGIRAANATTAGNDDARVFETQLSGILALALDDAAAEIGFGSFGDWLDLSRDGSGRCRSERVTAQPCHGWSAFQFDDSLRLATIDLASDAQSAIVHGKGDAIADGAAGKAMGEARRKFLTVGVTGEQNCAGLQLGANLNQQIEAKLGLILGQFRLVAEQDCLHERSDFSGDGLGPAAEKDGIDLSAGFGCKTLCHAGEALCGFVKARGCE